MNACAFTPTERFVGEQEQYAVFQWFVALLHTPRVRHVKVHHRTRHLPPVAGAAPITYYVRKTGSNSNAGTSAGAAFLTIDKARSVVAAGDTVYVGAGKYAEVVTWTTSGSAGNIISVIGDVTGSNTGDSGDVLWTNWTTNDTSAPSGSSTLDISARSYLSFSNIQFFGGGSQSCIKGTASGTIDHITWTNCGFSTNGGGTGLVNCNLKVDANGACLWDRCYFIARNGTTALTLGVARSSTADYDTGWKVRNCVFFGGNSVVGITINSAGSGAFFGGGGLVSQNIFFACNVVFASQSTTVSGLFPTVLVGNYAFNCNTGFNGSVPNGTVTEDYNLLDVGTARNSVAAGPNSNTSGNYAPMFETLGWIVTGRTARPFAQPMAGSNLLGWLAQSTQMAVGIPGTAADDATVGTITWTNPNNAKVPDGTFATCAILLGTTGHYLKMTNFGFAIPSTATITQIRVEFIGNKTGSGTLAANSIKLTKDGTTFIGNDNSATLSIMTGSNAIYTVGGAADLWGTTWAPADINASTFGVGISWKNTSVASTETPQVDYVRMIISYTDTTNPAEHAVDFTNAARPAGGNTSIAVGAFERSSTAAKETSTVHTGSNAIKLAGPSYQDFQLAVDAASTVISAYMRYDGSYGGSTLPTMQVVNGTECGVANASVSQVGASNTWEQVSLTIVPTSTGIVTVRFSNLSTAAAGNVYVDTFAVA